MSLWIWRAVRVGFFLLKLLIACRYLQRYSAASSGTTQSVFSLISPHSLPWIIFRAPSPAVGDLCVYGHYWRWVIHFVFFLLLLSWQRHVAPWGISITRVCLTPGFLSTLPKWTDAGSGRKVSSHLCPCLARKGTSQRFTDSNIFFITVTINHKFSCHLL